MPLTRLVPSSAHLPGAPPIPTLKGRPQAGQARRRRGALRAPILGGLVLALFGCDDEGRKIQVHVPLDPPGTHHPPTAGTSSTGGGDGSATGGSVATGGGDAGGSTSTGGSPWEGSGGTSAAGGSNPGSGGDTTSLGTPPIPYVHGLVPTTVTIEDAQAAYDAWKTVHLEDCSGGVYRVRWENARSDATVSEGIGYGMLLTVIWDDKEAFDGLYEYYKLALNGNGLMHWLRYGCDAHREEKYVQYPDDAAADADLDVAMALIMAHCKWGDERYATDAGNVIRPIREHMFVQDNGRHLLIPGDSGHYHDLGGGCVNYSYFAPAYYREYAAYDAGNEAFWNEAAEQTYDFLTAGSHASTGLVRNWGSADGNNRADGCSAAREDYNPDVYGDDAARTPWRIIVDYLWNGTPSAKAWTDQVTSWVSGVGIQNTVQWYNLDGSADMTPTGWDDHTNINVGPWAAGAMSSDQATLDQFAAEVVTIPAGEGAHDGEYFPRMLRALTLATLVGKFTTCGGAAP